MAVAIVSGVELLLADMLVPLFVDMTSPVAGEIVKAAIVRMEIVLVCYFLTGPMDVLTGYLRALGMSIMPMMTSFIFACGLRVLWCIFVFPLYGTPLSLFIIFPISWLATVLCNGIISVVVNHKVLRRKEVAMA